MNDLFEIHGGYMLQARLAIGGLCRRPGQEFPFFLGKDEGLLQWRDRQFPVARAVLAFAAIVQPPSRHRPATVAPSSGHRRAHPSMRASHTGLDGFWAAELPLSGTGCWVPRQRP